MAKIELIHGDCMEGMKRYPDKHFDSMVTDPPYGWAFMGKKWDYQVPSVELWQECLRVLKPGGHALVACGTRTQHRMATNLEDAGFEIRDIVAWLYGSGFPKSLNIGKAVDKLQGNERDSIGIRDSKTGKDKNTNWKCSSPRFYEDTKGTSEWEGWGTALKPAMELWTLCRKPLSEKTVASNVLKYGTGGLNIDESRIPLNGDKPRISNMDESNTKTYGWAKGGIYKSGTMPSQGRFPSNLILSCACEGEHEDDCPVRIMDEQSGERKAGGKVKGNEPSNTGDNGIYSSWGRVENNPFSDLGGASRFFYCAKASKSERNNGLDSYLTVKYNIPNGGVLCKDGIMVAVQLLPKVISGQGLVSFNIDESGGNIMALCRKDSLSIILMETKKIIESKILQLLMHSLTNESTLDVNYEMVNGGNLAENVERLKKLILTITKGNQELALGASNVALQMLLLISEKETWKDATNIHSTVKPLSLMQYLCKLITPPEGIVLEPFLGSGTTAIACYHEGFGCIGFEIEKDYFEIAVNRLEEHKKQGRLFDTNRRDL